VSGSAVAQALRVPGDAVTRQEGSHVRLTTHLNGVHHVTVPNHKPLKVGTLPGGILKPVAAHHGLSVEDLLGKLNL
jgi:predicted RNA binding protein YcfA (HicA-like mRNA interferase family)